MAKENKKQVEQITDSGLSDTAKGTKYFFSPIYLATNNGFTVKTS